MKKIFFQKKMIILKQQFCLILKKLTSTMMVDLHLRETHQLFSKIKKEILFIGKGNHFEIWQQDLGEKHKLESRKKFK